MAPGSGGAREHRELIRTHRAQALKLARDGEPFLVPIELATILAVGGEAAVDETATSWLSHLATLPEAGLDAVGLALVDHYATMFSLEDEVVAATIDLVRTSPPEPQKNGRWRNLELGQRVQVLLLMVHLVSRVPPGTQASTS